MAITTVAGVFTGMHYATQFMKTGSTPEAVNLPHSTFYEVGMPVAGSFSNPGINGVNCTSVTGQIPWRNPTSGNSYLARWEVTAALPGTWMLLDRLWHNTITLNITTLQTITMSGAIPARDRLGATNGDDVMCGLEFSVTGGTGAPTVTLTYTNQSGTGSRTATFIGVATPNQGSFFQWPLMAGDTGVRSVQSVQLSNTWTSGTAHMVLYRKLAQITMRDLGGKGAVDAVTGGMVRLYDDTVPFMVRIPTSTGATRTMGQLVVAQG